jgi:hypothetical protein
VNGSRRGPKDKAATAIRLLVGFPATTPAVATSTQIAHRLLLGSVAVVEGRRFALDLTVKVVTAWPLLLVTVKGCSGSPGPQPCAFAS